MPCILLLLLLLLHCRSTSSSATSFDVLCGSKKRVKQHLFPMRLSAGESRNPWQPIGGLGTTETSYWLNWRFALCAVWVVSSMAVASILIWKYEGSEEEEADLNGGIGALLEDEAWRPCLKSIHPAWLLLFRITAFSVFTALLVAIVLVDGASILYYYTEWTFVLVTSYFGLGSLLSAYGCHQYMNTVAGDRKSHVRLDSEHGACVSPTSTEAANGHHTVKNPSFQEQSRNQNIAVLCRYLFQIIYQTSAGAIMLTDFVFWLIIFPFLAMKDYDLNFLQIIMHSVNAIFLLGDITLNSLRFPWFRIAYFLLWTSVYVISQWIIHACVSIWWPYPFLDLSSVRAPIWYFAVAVLHVPCYAVFPLIIKLKHSLLTKWFPQSYYIANWRGQQAFRSAYGTS